MLLCCVFVPCTAVLCCLFEYLNSNPHSPPLLQVISTLIERNADLEAFCFEGAAIKTAREMVEGLIVTRQITQQAGIRDYTGDAKSKKLFGKDWSVTSMH